MREDFKAANEQLKPMKRAIQELVSLCVATAKDFKGAITAAIKRKQQEKDAGGKKRKVAANGPDSKQETLFDFIKEGGSVAQIPAGKMGDGTTADNDLANPFILNLPDETPGLGELLPSMKKILANFELEFQGSALRSSVGRASKPLDKLVSQEDLALEGKIMACVFNKMFPAQKLGNLTAEQKTSLGLQIHCFGLAKNTWTCVPERGHMPTASFIFHGSAMMVFVPLAPFLTFLASERGNPKLPLCEAVMGLKSISSDTFDKFLGTLKGDCKVYFGTVGQRDFLYVPPGWLPVTSVNNSDSVGVKLRLAVESPLEAMKALKLKLSEHDSASPVLEGYLAALQP